MGTQNHRRRPSKASVGGSVFDYSLIIDQNLAFVNLDRIRSPLATPILDQTTSFVKVALPEPAFASRCRRLLSV